MHRVWNDHEDPHSPHRLLAVPLYPHAYKAEEQALAADLSFLVWHIVSDIDFFWPAVVSVLEATTWESYSMYVMPHLRTVEPPAPKQFCLGCHKLPFLKCSRVSIPRSAGHLQQPSLTLAPLLPPVDPTDLPFLTPCPCDLAFSQLQTPVGTFC